jgi:hypothetical protein
MKILHTADWHFDLPNLDFTAWAVNQMAGSLEDGPPVDVAVIAGDLAVHRGSVNPHVAFEIRRAVGRLARATRRGALVLTGNHDQSFHTGRAGTVRGLLHEEGRENVETFEEPDIALCADADGCTVAFAMVPTPNKYWMRAAGLEDGADAAEALEAAIRGLIARARESKTDRVVVVYHGTVAGCMAGDERVMVAGMDVAVRRDCFAGADAVMLGHIHNRQDWPATDALPAMVYCGAVAPLTWNDRAMAPAFALWTITKADVSFRWVALPVKSQMVDLAVRLADGDTAADVIRGAVHGNAAVAAGSRVRVRMSGPQAALKTLTSTVIDDIVQKFSLRSLKIVAEPTDDSLVRLDLGTGWTMEDALASYMDFTDTRGQTRERVREYARTVERVVADGHLDARYDFRPVRLDGWNWCQFGSFDVDFEALGTVVAVAGANFAGKSNLARALAFAVYKQQLAGTRQGTLVRKGTREANVAVTFDSGGTRYKVRRTLKLAGDGSATADVDFLRLDGATWAPINEGTASKTQAAIEALVGPWDYFEATTWAGQNAIDKVLDLSPAGMKDRLMGLLHRNFEDRVKAASAELAGIESRRGALESQRAGNTAIVAKYAGAQEAAEKAAEAANIGAALLGDDERGLAGAVTALEAARAAESTLRERRAAVAAAAEQEQAAKARLAKVVDDAGGADGLRAQIADLDALDADDGPDFAAAADAMEAATVAADVATEALRRANTNRHAALDMVKELRRTADERVRSIRADLAASRTAGEQARRQAAIRQSVPCGGRTFIEDVSEGPGREPVETEVVTAGCRFLLDAMAAEREVPLLAQRVADLEVAEQTAIGEASAHADALRAADKESAQAVDRETGLNATAQQALAEARASLKAATTTQRQRKARADLRAGYAADLAVAERAAADVPAFKADHDGTVGTLIAARAAAAECGDAAARLADAAADVERLQGIVQTDRRSIAANEQEAAVQRERVAAAADAAAAVQAVDAEITSLNRDHEAVAYYRAAMHRDGLPFLLLESFAIPALQRLANEYLVETNFRVQVTSERELASGEQRNAVEVTFTDHRGTHPVSAASGYQRTAIGMAFMAAQADISAEATGSRVWFAVQDEGFGTMDPENLEGAKRAIRRIGSHRGHFVFISHVPGMSEAADSVLTVVDENGLSAVVGDR